MSGLYGRSGRVRKASIRSLDLPARREALYRLSYPGPQVFKGIQVGLLSFSTRVADGVEWPVAVAVDLTSSSPLILH